MSIKTGLLVISVAVFVLISGSLYVVSQAVNTEADIARAESRRYQSYKLADELRQSSDDLTRMARLYAVTGEARYQAYFDRILAIRDGQAPRPLDYGDVYWDFVMAWDKPPRRDGKAVSLETLMREAHFTSDELALLQQAKQRSDALVTLETRSMHAVQGRFLDDRGHFTLVGAPSLELARRLLHGTEYQRAKAEIMAPIQEFFTRVESRTAADVQRLRRRGERLHFVVLAGLGTAVILVAISFAVVARYPFAAVPREGASARRDGVPAGRSGLSLGLAIWTIWPLLTAAVVACALVLGLSWWLGESTNDRVRDSTRSALEAVHQSTARSVDDWLAGIEREAGAWAGSPLVRGLLLRAPTGTGELLAPLRRIAGVAGYFIVDSEGRVVASDDAELLSRPVPRRVGESLLSDLRLASDHSIVLLPDGDPGASADDARLRRDILVAVGILDQQGAVGGALVLRVDPRLELSRILERGRLGESGETYAFTRSGSMISESRFRDQLRGLTALGVEPGSNVDLRDPGADLTAGGRAAAPRPDQPLTRMARAALAGRSGVDLDGYRDYRGVPVIGAWTWNERYGIGSATEVGRAEAYGALSEYQRHTRAATGLSLLLIAGLTGVFAWNRLAMATAAAKLETAYEIIRGHRDRMEAELQVGHDLQLSMVPRVFPAFPARDGVSVYATLRPARELSGDFYDYYFVDDTHLFFCVGDVSDKGVPAALFMAVTKTLLRARSAGEVSTAKIADYLNAELCRDNEKCMFVTLFMGRLDVATGECVYTNAGHDPPYVRHADGSVRPLADRHGPFVGVAPDVVYRESRHQLAPGDLLVVYTDGVTEAQDAGGRFFSEERMAGIMRTDDAQSTHEIVDRLLAAVETFEAGAERADDITVLALQLVPAGDREAALVETAVLGNALSELDRLDEILDRFGQQARLPATTVTELRIVCDEIVSNTINHGYPQGGQHDIEVRLELTGHRLVMTVSDDGVPFNPLEVAPPDTTLPLEEREPGGLGIHLLRSLTDDVTYSRQGSRNVITLVKMVPSPSADPAHGTPREPRVP